MQTPPSYEELMAAQGPGGILEEYELLAACADRAFEKVAGEYGALVQCRDRCDDCCYALFGLFPIESVYLGYHFQAVDERSKREAIARGDRFDEELLAIQKRSREDAANPDALSLALAREKVRCPLLSDERCLLYSRRPVTCRVYGIPTIIHGRSHVCGKSGFTKGRSFPAFNLDMLNRDLYRLSVKLLEAVGHSTPEEASSLLLSVSRSLGASPAELLRMHDAG